MGALAEHDRRGLGALVRDLADGSARLVRDELRLARLELAEMMHDVGRGTAEVVGGGVLALLGAMALLTGVILLVADAWLRHLYWLAALIVMVVLAVAAWWLMTRGLALLSPARLKPDETMETLKEDRAWLKRPLTSDATSN